MSAGCQTSATSNPPDCAAAVNATVPFDELPATTDEGLIDTAASAGGERDDEGITNIGAGRVTPPHVAAEILGAGANVAKGTARAVPRIRNEKQRKGEENGTDARSTVSNA